MTAIKLLCKTRGLNFGDSLDVGTKKSEITQKEAEALISEGLAKEIKPLIDGTKTELAKENEALKEELKTVSLALEKMKKENEALAAELKALKEPVKK